MRRTIVALLSALVLALSVATSMAATHPGHDHKIMGTVSMVGADHVMVKDKDGKDATAMINKDTRFVRARKPMKAADVRLGMRVVITAVTDEADDKSIAKVIELGPDPVTKS